MGERVGHSLWFGKFQNTLNFNAWQAGLERMTLGYAMREEQGVGKTVLDLIVAMD